MQTPKAKILLLSLLAGGLLSSQVRVPGPGGHSGSGGCASGSVTFNAGTFSTWTVPSGCTLALVEAWSSGGNGGISNTGMVGGSGGGGGGYIKASLAVSAGQNYTVLVPGSPGAGATTFSFGATIEVEAFAAGNGSDDGGTAGGGGSGTVGGSAVLVVTFPGGQGANGTINFGGGGGGNGSPSGTGGNGGLPGGGSPGGGNGGVTGFSGGISGGFAAGGGGGGNTFSGAGGTGQVKITYS